MIKRLGVFASVFVAVFAVAVSADMVEATVLNVKKTWNLARHAFIVNSPNGYVIPQKNPGEAKETFIETSKEVALPKYENGFVLFIKLVSIHEGKYWGHMPDCHACNRPGWIPMDHLLSIYTSADFEEENRDKFYEYAGSYDAVTSAEEVVLWEWPGSDKVKRIVEKRYEYSPYTNTPYPMFNQNNIYTDKTYTDKEGREWSKAGYYYDVGGGSYVSGWICLNDPQNSDIPAFNPAPAPVKWSPDDITVYSLRGIPSDLTILFYMSLVVIFAAVIVFTARTSVSWKSNKIKPIKRNDD